MKKRIRRHVRTAKYIFYKETLIDLREHFWTFIGAFSGIGLIGFFHSKYFSPLDNLFLIGSFGASSVLIYGLINSPLAQPRNLLGGHIVCAFVGVTIHKLIPGEVWIAPALAVSLSIVLMQVSKTLDPPGGATALIATIGTEKVKSLGYLYVLSPVFTGALILFLVAIFFNNRTKHRSYPHNKNWYKVWQRYRK